MSTNIRTFCLLLLIVVQGKTQATVGTPHDIWLPGSKIQHPEDVSGVWQTNEGQGFIGLNIRIDTVVENEPIELSRTSQTFRDAYVRVFQQQGQDQNLQDGNWFKYDTAAVKSDNVKLVIHNPGTKTVPAVDVELAFDPLTQSWSGRFHRGSVDRSVVLRRPKSAIGIAPSPFVGTWQRASLTNNCIHIAQNVMGNLVAWSDDLRAPRAYRYAAGVKPPIEISEQYGFVALASASSSERIVVTFKPFEAMCCSTIMSGSLSPDGRFIRLDANSATVKTPANIWKRVAGSSCSF